MSSCALCQFDLPASPICFGDKSFCCNGCHTVFTVLSARSQLDNFQGHPLFLQAVQAGLISNPNLLEKVKATGLEWQKVALEIQEMWCPSCAEIIKLLLMQEKGIGHCVVDYATDLASIEYSPQLISKAEIMALVRSYGYAATPLGEAKPNHELTLRFGIAAFFSLNIMMFAYPLYATYFNIDDDGAGPLFAWLSCIASLPVLFYSGWPILKRFCHSMQMGMPGMETLVVLGVGASFALSLYDLLQGGTRVYFDSMSVIITFVLFGKMIETKAKLSAKTALTELTKGLPRRGRKKLNDGSWQFVSLKEIQVGDLLSVGVGEKIVLDGLVREGEGTANEALMTGEALPIPKREGDKVLGGSHLQHGWVAYAVTATQEQSALQKIVHMIEQDLGKKGQLNPLVDQIVRWFVPAVILLAALTAGVGVLLEIQDPFMRAVSILLISCPCAIGIAAPLAEAHLINALAHAGVLVRNRASLQFLGKETLFAFDKTGTLTEGRFEVLEGLENLGKSEKSALKGLVEHSSHPIAVALSKVLDGNSLKFDRIEEMVGQGIRGEGYALGSASFLHISENPAPFTQVYFVKNETLLTKIILGDRLRADVPQLTVRTVLLSGDSVSATEEIARQAHIDEFHAKCTPGDKKGFIEKWKAEGHIVAMVGDGINDAPSLTAAHVGISLCSASDISIQVSDLLLTSNKLSLLPQIQALGRRGRAILHQNLFWAFFYNVMGLALAVTGLLSPVFSAFAMIMSSLTVLLNAQRLK